MFDLKKYTYEIFNIAGENDVDVGVAKDMFMSNVRNDEERYKGVADYVDYHNLHSIYVNSSTAEVQQAYNDYSDFMLKNYHALGECYRNHDVNGFITICNQ